MSACCFVWLGVFVSCVCSGVDAALYGSPFLPGKDKSRQFYLYSPKSEPLKGFYNLCTLYSPLIDP